MKLRLLVLVLCVSPLLGCVQTPKPSSAYVGRPSYEERFDPWRANNRALKPAALGNRIAQNTFFLCGYVRQAQGESGGEDLEQMADNYSQLLGALGDNAFAQALERQRPEVRSAACGFLELKAIQAICPKTYHLLKSAPIIKWPENLYG